MAQQMQNINQAAEQLTDATQQAFRILADRTVALQESNLRLTQNSFKNWIEQLNNQAQGTREVVQNLRYQGQRQREAVGTLSQEATNTYSEFLNSAIGFYQNALGTATQVAQQNMQQGAQATQQSVQAAVQATSQTAQQATDVANQAGQQSAQAANQEVAQQATRGEEQVAQEGAVAAQGVATGVSIEDYDNLNVGEIVEQLDNLSVDELQRVRTYEQQNKDRDTLLEQIDRKMMVATGVPIRDYDNLNVGEIVEQLDNLSAEELQAARAYEQQNKDRDTLLEQIERRIKAAS
jgi:hypothetical protein